MEQLFAKSKEIESSYGRALIQVSAEKQSLKSLKKHRVNIRQPEELSRDHPTAQEKNCGGSSRSIASWRQKANHRSALCECRVPNEEMSFEARDKCLGR